MIKLTNIKRTILIGIATITMMASTMTAFAAGDDYTGPTMSKDTKDQEIVLPITQIWNTNDADPQYLNEKVTYKVVADPDSTFDYTGITLTPTEFTLDGSNTDETPVSQDLTFKATHAGVFTYFIQVDNDKTTAKAGATYDSTVYAIRAYVKNVDGELVTTITAERDYTKDKADEDRAKANSIYFSHEFKAASSGDSTDAMGDPPVKKTITGDRKYTSETFTFRISADENNPAITLPRIQDKKTGKWMEHKEVAVQPKDAKSNTAEFGDINFPKLGTYTYYIEEINDGKKGYTYDKHVYTIKYVVKEVDEIKDGEKTGKKVWEVTRTFYRGDKEIELPGTEEEKEAFAFEFTNNYKKSSGGDGHHKHHDDDTPVTPVNQITTPDTPEIAEGGDNGDMGGGLATTGDDSNMILYAIIAALAAAGLTTWTIYRKKAQH